MEGPAWPKGTVIDISEGGAEIQAWLDKMDGGPLAVVDWDARWIEACRNTAELGR